MASTSTYLNFPGTTEEAFLFYKSVFRTELGGPIMRMRDVPPFPGGPELSEREKGFVMHVMLPITGGHVLMGTDTLASMENVSFGTAMHINVQPDTRAETERIFAALSAGGKVTMPLAEMFWGDYFGSLVDKFGVPWMFNCAEKKA